MPWRMVKLTNLQLNNLQNNTLTTLTVMSKWLMYWVLNNFRIFAFGDGGEASKRRPWDSDYRKWKRKHAKTIKAQEKKKKEERFNNAVAEIEAARAGPVVEERESYVYDSSILGQLKVYIRDIKNGIFGSCANGLNKLAEMTGNTSDINDPFRWPERIEPGEEEKGGLRKR